MGQVVRCAHSDGQPASRYVRRLPRSLGEKYVKEPIRHIVRYIYIVISLVFSVMGSIVQAASLEEFGFRVFQDFNLNYEWPETNYQQLLIKHFGAPTKVREWRNIETREPDYIDHFETWEYEGLDITLYHSIWTKAGDQQVEPAWAVSRVFVNDASLTLAGNLHIGSLINTFIEVLGLNTTYIDLTNQEITYSADHYYSHKEFDMAQHVTINFDVNEKGEVASITWSYWAD